MTPTETSTRIPIPPFAEGPNGNPWRAELMRRATIGLFFAAMTALALTGVLNHRKPQLVLTSFAIVVVLGILSVLAYARYLHHNPVPTRDELVEKWRAQIAELQSMIDQVGESPARRTMQTKLNIMHRQLAAIGAGPLPSRPNW